MKLSLIPSKQAATLVAALAGLGSAQPLLAADDILIDDFTDPAAAASTVRWWGNAVQTYEHDATQDADGNAASGALKVTIEFDLAAYGGENQFSARRELAAGVVDGSQYATLEFDLKYDAGSVAAGTSGTYGTMEVGIAHSDWSQAYFGNVRTTVGENGWRHISLPVNKLDPKLNDLRDFHFKLWSGGAANGMTGKQTFWIDNVKLIALPSTEPPPPPPAVSVVPAKPGLNLIASGGGQYSRQGIRTTNPEHSWVDVAGPVTYSMTITDYPALPNFTSYFYLVPAQFLGTGVTGPDWSEPKCILGAINNNADGSASMRIAYKNHVANSNGYETATENHNYYVNETFDDLYDGVTGPGAAGTGKGGTLGFANSSTVLGTWSITFTNNTGLTITPPAGDPLTVSLPNEATARLFANPMYAYFGVVPGQEVNKGQAAVVSRVQVEGTANPVDEDFSAPPFDISILEKAADNAPGVVQVVPTENPYWLVWSLPAVGYLPQQSPTLGVTPEFLWQDLSSAEIINANTRRLRLLNVFELSDPDTNFFRLAKP